jgi:hypothetical protein
MTKKPLLIIPAILILHSAVFSTYSLWSGPSRYASRGFGAVWPQLVTPILAVFLVVKVKAKFWGVSVIVILLADIPRVLTATFPDYTLLLVAITLGLDVISAVALYLAFHRDTFDVSLFRSSGGLRTPFLLKAIIALVIMVGIFWYVGRP